MMQHFARLCVNQLQCGVEYELIAVVDRPGQGMLQHQTNSIPCLHIEATVKRHVPAPWMPAGFAEASGLDQRSATCTRRLLFQGEPHQAGVTRPRCLS